MQTPTNREELHDLLVDILGSNHVYYDPPESVKIRYPAIVYHMNHISNRYANSRIYNNTFTFTATLIDEDPESEIVEKMLSIPYCKHNQHYQSNGMTHDVFTIKF